MRSTAAESPRETVRMKGGSLVKWGQGSPRGTGQMNAGMGWLVQGLVAGWKGGVRVEVLVDKV